MRRVGATVLLSLSLGMAAAAFAAPPTERFTAGLAERIGPVANPSFVQVRENNVEGSHLPFKDLGVHTVFVTELNAAYRTGDRSAVDLAVRRFDLSGTSRRTADVAFNGALIPGGSDIRTDPVWYSVLLAYRREARPRWLDGGTIAASLGLEYTSVDFRLNKGHAPVEAASTITETKETFERQELPLPTIGLSLCRSLGGPWQLNAATSANWADHWNSLRKEGGTIYLSQWKVEGQVGLRLADDRRFRAVHPMIGLFAFAYRQREDSREDTNRVRLTSFGPIAAVDVAF